MSAKKIPESAGYLDPSEEELLESRLQKFMSFMKEYDNDVVIPTIARFISNSIDAEDIYQETWLRVWQKLDQCRRNPRAWLATLTKNVCLTWYRKIYSRSLVQQRLYKNQPSDSSRTNGNKFPFESEVFSALRGLSQEQHRIICLKYHEYKTFKEIAERLHISEGRVKREHIKAIRRLKDLLSGSE